MEEPSHADAAVRDFATYEDFLDSQISPIDLYYLEDEELARQLVELGYRGTGEVGKEINSCIVCIFNSFADSWCLPAGDEASGI